MTRDASAFYVAFEKVLRLEYRLKVLGHVTKTIHKSKHIVLVS